MPPNALTPEQWDSLQQLLETARRLTGPERESFVQQIFVQDPDLGSELRELLACDAMAADFLETPLLKAAEMVGQTVLHYRIMEKAGAGGMGEVYVAEDLALSRRVALKILPPHLAEDPIRLRRFLREAKAASALNHPNIATIHALEQSSHLQFIVMEYVEGQTLATLIESREIPLPEGLGIVMQVANALGAAHLEGIVHRDVKPANIMVRADGCVKVLDFGIAKRLRVEWCH